MGVLSHLEPKEFFHYFEEISNIPRGSYHEKEISDYLVNFAKERELEAYQDEQYSLLIKKPGTSGYENSPPLLFHSHMDMVLEKDEGVEQDMLKEGIRLKIDGDFIKGDGTTLGADNGVGVAIVLCVLDSKDIPHPPIEAIITVQEEVGKVGAQKFDASRVKGKRLMDFNWHDPHSIFAGCAGDISAWVNIPVAYEAGAGFVPMKLQVKGLMGGHSEFDIHLERANAIKLVARIVNTMQGKADVRLVELAGGVNRYVIPNDITTTLCVRAEDTDAMAALAAKLQDELRNEYRISDPGLTVVFEPQGSKVEQVMTADSTAKVVKTISLIPNGVQSMSLSIPGLVESSNTVAMLETTQNTVRVLNTIPSAVTSRRYNILQTVRNLADLAGGTVETFADCPEWPYLPDSQLLASAKKAYRSLFGEDPHVEVSHSSLELGLFTAKIPGIEMISIGPEAYDVHTTKERLNYKTVEPVWNLTKAILKELK